MMKRILTSLSLLLFASLAFAQATTVTTTAVQTITGAKTFSGSCKALLAGSTSGTTCLNAPAIAGSTTQIVFPAVAGTLATLAGTETFTNKSIDAGQLTGSIAAARLPNPSSSTLGGVQSAASVSHQWVNSISTSGVPSLSQPAVTDISGLGSGVGTWLATPTGANFVSVLGCSGTSQYLRSDGACAVPPGVGASVSTDEGIDDDLPGVNTGRLYLASDSRLIYVGGASDWYVAGFGPNKCTIGPFSDSNYLTAATTGTDVGPKMTNPYTLALGFYVTSLPGTSGKMLMAFTDTASFNNGWFLANNTTNNNKLRLTMKSVNSHADNLVDVTLTTGAHVLAINYNGSAVRYSYDGGAVGNFSTTGTMTAPNGTFMIGRWLAGAFPGDWAAISWIRGFASAVSDGDLQTLSGSPTTYAPPAISTAVAWDWKARRQGGAGMGQLVLGTQANATAGIGMIGALAKTPR